MCTKLAASRDRSRGCCGKALYCRCLQHISNTLATHCSGRALYCRCPLLNSDFWRRNVSLSGPSRLAIMPNYRFFLFSPFLFFIHTGKNTAPKWTFPAGVDKTAAMSSLKEVIAGYPQAGQADVDKGGFRFFFKYLFFAFPFSGGAGGCRQSWEGLRCGFFSYIFLVLYKVASA